MMTDIKVIRFSSPDYQQFWLPVTNSPANYWNTKETKVKMLKSEITIMMIIQWSWRGGSISQ